MLQAELLVKSGKQAGNSIGLQSGKFLVGREEDCHLRPNSDLVSRHHCVFTADEFAVRVRDLGSTNGTFVNGERIRGGVMLQSGDTISIGKLDFEVVIRDLSGEETQTLLGARSDTQVDVVAGASDVLDQAESVEEVPGQVISGGEEETAPVEPSTTQTVAEFPAMQQPPTGDTQMITPPGMMQPPVAYPQMGFPQQMMPYGYPGYPPGMYPQQMGYPQAPGMMPQMPQPGQEAPPQEPAGRPVDDIPVRLPDPSDTGLEAEKPKSAGDDEGGDTRTTEQKSKEESPGMAANIIQQYMNRRPSSK